MRATGNTGLANRPLSCQCIFDRLLAKRSIATRDAKREREAADLDEADTADLARGNIEHRNLLRWGWARRAGLRAARRVHLYSRAIIAQTVS